MSDEETPTRKKNKHEDAEELREIFSALNESIPKLISGLIGSVYSPEAAVRIAKAIGGFYRELIEQGIPEELALEMTKSYVSALDFKSMMDTVGEGKGSKSVKIKIDHEDSEDDD